MGGISGAFLLLPFQVSFLHFTGPGVSPTNLIFNIVAIPGGVYRYLREGRMAWPLTWVVIIGTLPGVFIGVILRIEYLPDPRPFKFFVGCVLLHIGFRMVYDLSGRGKKIQEEDNKRLEERFSRHVKDVQKRKRAKLVAGLPPEAVVKTLELRWNRIKYEFFGQTFSFNTPGVLALSLIVGIVGGTYGIGGGAIIAPFLVAIFGLPIYTVAGAVLMGTFLTSIAGVIFYTAMTPIYAHTGLQIAPDWLLGLLFGLGGFGGTYCGARFQKFVPAVYIKRMLCAVILVLSLRYIWQYFT